MDGQEFGKYLFPIARPGVRPYHRECYMDKSAAKYLFRMTRPDPKKSLEAIDKRHINMI
jgi:hypothetical protein